MRTLKQIEASRANGAKSRGPVTAEGKAQSSRNALTHGLTGAEVCTGVEKFEAFENRLAEYVKQFQPDNQVEMDLVVEMAIARHKLLRITGLETSLLEVEMAQQARDIEKTIPNVPPAVRLACAFKELAENSKALDLLHRYATAARRQYDRALQNLFQIQKDRRARQAAWRQELDAAEQQELEAAEPAAVQNEPGTEELHSTPNEPDPGLSVVSATTPAHAPGDDQSDAMPKGENREAA